MCRRAIELSVVKTDCRADVGRSSQTSRIGCLVSLMLRPQPSCERQQRFAPNSRTFCSDCQIISGVLSRVKTQL